MQLCGHLEGSWRGSALQGSARGGRGWHRALPEKGPLPFPREALHTLWLQDTRPGLGQLGVAPDSPHDQVLLMLVRALTSRR